MRARTAEWHQMYTLPSLWAFFEPSRENHGSYWYYWTTEDEYAWKKFYQVWMSLINDYKNKGGRVTTGTDSGFIYKTLWLLVTSRSWSCCARPASTRWKSSAPLRLYGAQALHEPKGKPIEFGIIRPGLLADLVIVDQNPLENLKVLYGTGTIKLNDETGNSGACRRRQVHHQGRHRLRFEEAAGRRRRHGRAGESAPPNHGVGRQVTTFGNC